MARIRSIKPELWLSAQVMNLSHGARLLFIGLITQADDEGRGSSDPRKLKAAIFGGDDVTLEQLGKWIEEIVGQRLAAIYEADGYGHLYLLPSWGEHQYVPKPTPSRYPQPVDNLLPERYRNTTGTLPGDRKGSDVDRKGSDARAKNGSRPAGKAAGAAVRAPEQDPEVLTAAQQAARAAAIADNARQLERVGLAGPRAGPLAQMGAVLKAVPQ